MKLDGETEARVRQLGGFDDAVGSARHDAQWRGDSVQGLVMGRVDGGAAGQAKRGEPAGRFPRDRMSERKGIGTAVPGNIGQERAAKGDIQDLEAATNREQWLVRGGQLPGEVDFHLITRCIDTPERLLFCSTQRTSVSAGSFGRITATREDDAVTNAQAGVENGGVAGQRHYQRHAPGLFDGLRVGQPAKTAATVGAFHDNCFRRDADEGLAVHVASFNGGGCRLHAGRWRCYQEGMTPLRIQATRLGRLNRTLHLLVVTLRLPFPPVGGLSLRTWHFVRALAAKHRVTVCGFTYGEAIIPPEFPVEIVPVPYTSPLLYEKMQSADPDVSCHAYEQLATGTDEPWSASYFDCPAFGKRLGELATHADVAVIVGSSMGRFLPYLPASLAKTLDFPDVYTSMVERDSKPQSTVEIERVRRFEQRVATGCVRRVVCSSLERVRAREALGLTDVDVVSNGVDTKQFQPFAEPPVPGNLLFVGAMHYQPNAAAAEYFVRDILPLVRRDNPEARLHIVGDSPPAGVRALASDAVVVHGFVPDVRPFYREAAVVVAPLLVGGGTRLKLLEAAACGKAVVSTTLGAEGLDFTSGRDILLADTPVTFAAAVSKLLREPTSLSAAARRTAERYEWSDFAAQFCGVVEQAAQISA